MSNANVPAIAAPFLTVIVPCFNEENGIRPCIEALCAALKGKAEFQIVVVDDGSTDGTPRVLGELATQFAELKVIQHSVNAGYGASIKTGIRQTSSPLIAITDADGTYPADRLPDLLKEMEFADMAVGDRSGPDVKYPFVRRIPKLFLKAYVSWIARQHVPDMNSGLRIFKRSIAEKFLPLLPDGFSLTTTITLAMLTNRYRVVYLPISYAPRTGKSKIQPLRDTIRFFVLIMRTGMYFAPMRVIFPIAVLIGLAFLASLGHDVAHQNLTDKTVILLLFAMNTGMFALLADMIDKRSNS